MSHLHAIQPMTRDMLALALARLRAYWLWLLVVFAGVVAFFGSPAGLDATARSVLHGLCAQTPSHTLAFDGRMLPFDSRMTGIYGGFLLTVAVIAMRGRLFRYGNPPRAVVAILAAAIGLMAVDGFNSLLTDLGAWHPYAPHNAYRVVTGYGCGVALAVALSWLLASSVWNLGDKAPSIAGLPDLAIPFTLLAPYGFLLLTRPGWLYGFVTVFLVASAWLTVSMLVLVIVILAFRLDELIARVGQLHVPVAIAGLLAIIVMLALAGARFWVEHRFGITNEMM